jgi:tRNA (cmo5U34)-methyltransferase
MGKPLVLIVCTANSARSQMAEGLMRQYHGDRFEVASAGTIATRVREEAIAAMDEIGIDIRHHTSKSIDGFLDRPIEYLITVCDHAAANCPHVPGAKHRLHWPFPDPTPETFGEVRDRIRSRIEQWQAKASVAEIRERFDHDVERFSNLETGQMSTQDAPLVLETIAGAAARVTPEAKALLDLGCGAGNFSLKLAERFSFERITLVDLSANMLDRAMQRLTGTGAELIARQCDIRDLELEPESQDLIVAAAVLHHLRAEIEWVMVFRRLYQALRPGGSLWIWDLIEHDIPGLQAEMWHRYGQYLESLKGPEYREHVFNYIGYEDSPRSVAFQLHHLRAAGFQADAVHKNGCFAAIAAAKPA